MSTVVLLFGTSAEASVKKKLAAVIKAPIKLTNNIITAIVYTVIEVNNEAKE